MNRLPIPSDHLAVWSDDSAGCASTSITPTSPQTGARVASARPDPSRLTDRDLQALRTTELPLRARTGAWPEAVPGHQSTRWAAAQRLCPECCPQAGFRSARQLPQGARGAQRDLRHQCRTPAPTRGSRLDRRGPGPRLLRPCPGRRHPRRHGGFLSRRRCLAVRSGGRP
jgi:hypothetical protein